MNKRDRKRIHKAFVAAKEHLATNMDYDSGTSTRYICFALSKAEAAGKINNDTDWDASRIVSNRLGTHPYVEGYLQSIGAIPATYPISAASYQLAQDFRHLWLDALIKEFAA